MTRKFYRYWKASNRLVDESEQKNIHVMAQKKALTLLWYNIDAQFFSNLEICQLTQYTDSLVVKGLTEKDIVLSSKIAKVIMIELRHDKATSDTYRDAINRTQVQFKGEELGK